MNFIEIACDDATNFCESISDDSIDLFICDPPFGINEENFSGARTKNNIIPGYIPAPKDISYYDFCKSWLQSMFKKLKSTGTAYVICGWSYPLAHLMLACEDVGFHLINHIIWHYDTKIIPTSKKFSSSHYHILRLGKKKNGQTFNAPDIDKTELWYDKMDTWTIPKNRLTDIRNLNTLPYDLIRKIIQYSSNPNDIVCDLFCGNFTTTYVCIDENRNFIGCELNINAYNHHKNEINSYLSQNNKKYDFIHQ